MTTAVPAQMDPSLLPPGDKWEWQCRVSGCSTITQGGFAGLRAHQETVHETPPVAAVRLARPLTAGQSAARVADVPRNCICAWEWIGDTRNPQWQLISRNPGCVWHTGR